MKTLIKEVHIFPEPSGAASTALLETGVRDRLGKNVVVVVSGGNVSLELLSRVLSQ